MPKGKGYPGSRRTSGGGTNQQNAAGTPGLTPGGDGGTMATYRGQPTATGERGSMGNATNTPNEMKDFKGDHHMFPKTLKA